MPAVTEVPFKEGTMWSYGDELYDNYEDIPFKGKRSYETGKKIIGDYFTEEWNKIPEPGKHLLKSAAGLLGKGVQYIDQVQPENPLYGLNVALDTLKFADEKLTQGSKFLEKQTGIYAPITKVASELAIDYLASGGAGKLAKGTTMLANQADELFLGATRLNNLAYATVDIADEGLFKSVVRDVADTKFKSNTMFAVTTTRVGSSGFKRAPRTQEVKQLIEESKEFKPVDVPSSKWGNYIEKFGNKDSALAAIEKAKTSAEYLKINKSLKGNNNLWEDPITGEVYLVKNKAKRGEINIGFDSIKNIERTLANRLKGAKLNIDEIKRIGKKELGWDDAKVARYIEESHQAKKTLERLIRDLNKGEGRTMWSLGHRTAVKHLPHSADRIFNIELEPLVDVITKEGRKISGNTGRAAHDELLAIMAKMTNNPVDLKADMLHWGDDILGNFMPRMREITDAKTFFEEIVKREDFINKIEALAKKNTDNIPWEKKLEIAGNEVMDPLMKKTKTNQPTYFD
tara:strand:- start:47 stop:1591 length:1545 start_codon:yes stop_codon:yes gene_type:complete